MRNVPVVSAVYDPKTLKFYFEGAEFFWLMLPDGTILDSDISKVYLSVQTAAAGETVFKELNKGTCALLSHRRRVVARVDYCITTQKLRELHRQGLTRDGR